MKVLCSRQGTSVLCNVSASLSFVVLWIVPLCLVCAPCLAVFCVVVSYSGDCTDCRMWMWVAGWERNSWRVLMVVQYWASAQYFCLLCLEMVTRVKWGKQFGLFSFCHSTEWACLVCFVRWMKFSLSASASVPLTFSEPHHWTFKANVAEVLCHLLINWVPFGRHCSISGEWEVSQFGEIENTPPPTTPYLPTPPPPPTSTTFVHGI